MGLDIILVKIIEEEVREHNHLEVADSPELLPLFSKYIRSKHFKFGDEEYDENVFFYEEISYQRKGVQREFYDAFQNEKCLTEIAEVERLFDFVEKENQTQFKVDFIDKFVNGETVVIVSW